MDKYVVIANIKVIHEFFEDGICPMLDISMNSGTKELLYRRQILLKRTGISLWVLLCSQEAQFANGDKVSLDFIYDDPRFIIYTAGKYEMMEDDKQKPDFNVVYSVDIELSTSLPKDIDVYFKANEAYWKYILIPRSGVENSKRLELTETTGMLKFREAENDKTMKQEARTFISQKPVPMRNHYPYNIKLNEMTDHGPKILKRKVESPDIDNYGRDNKQERVLIKYIYY